MLFCCYCSVTQACLTLCNPMDCSTPGLRPSPSPKVCPSSCPLLQWCHPDIPDIPSSDALFFFCPQSFPASGIFLTSWLFTSDDQNTGISASASILPTSIQGWFPLRFTRYWYSNKNLCMCVWFLCVWFQLLLHKLWAHDNLYQRNTSISQAGSLWFYHPIYKREPRWQRGLSQCFISIRPKPLCCQGQAIFYNLLSGYILILWVMYWSFLGRKPLQISSYIRLHSSEQPGPNQS